MPLKTQSIEAVRCLLISLGKKGTEVPYCLRIGHIAAHQYHPEKRCKHQLLMFGERKDPVEVTF